MFRNHFKIAIRNLWNNRFFTFLNLSGLAIGLAVSLSLLLYVRDEMAFDKYHVKGENIYRVGVDVTYEDINERWACVPNITGPTLKEELVEVEEQVRMLKHNFGRTAFVSAGDKHVAEDNIFWVDPSIFNVLDIPILEGDPTSALDGPNKIMLSESTANRLFPYESPIGKMLKIDNNVEVNITGVFKDFPSNSSYNADFLGSFKTMKWASDNLYWSNCSFETLILLHPTAAPATVESKFESIIDKHVEKEDRWFSLNMQPFHDIHLYSSGISSGYSVKESNVRQVQVLGIMALAVLLLACFNYINMTTARSQQRFREVGINKTLGASTGQMVRRFYVETGLLVAIALVIGVVMVEASLPLFENLSGRSLSVSNLLDNGWWMVIPLVWLLVSLGAGLYPAFFLSSFTPKSLLAPKQTGQKGNQFFRQTLVIGQFTVCVALIIGAIVFNRQLNYIGQKNLGYQPEQVLAINTSGAESSEQLNSLANTIKSIPAVQKQVRMQAFPGITTSGYSMSKPASNDDGAYTSVSSCRSEPGFEEVLGLKILAGKTLPEKTKEDTTIQVVMNEAGVKFLGWTPDEALGKNLPDLYNGRPTFIVGVVEDFHFQSLHMPITPYVFTNGNGLGGKQYMLVKLQAHDLQNTLRELESNFKEAVPSSAFQYTFLDEQVGDMYENEKRLSTVILIFTLLTIFISCLGLFGLAAFTAERRTKEIGIRKVLGASVSGLVGLLAKEFMKPVAMAILLAAPIAYIGMNYWLQDFAYRVEMQWWYLFVAGSAAVIIAFLTVSLQSLKAAIANPVESLKTE